MEENLDNIQLPTNLWRERSNSDPYFNEENISATEKVLITFLERLKNSNGSKEIIFESVKQVVFALNELGGINGKLGNYIETTEREELCHFILASAESAGLKLAKEKDITEEWREW